MQLRNAVMSCQHTWQYNNQITHCLVCGQLIIAFQTQLCYVTFVVQISFKCKSFNKIVISANTFTCTTLLLCLLLVLLEY